MTTYAFDLATSGNFQGICYGVFLSDGKPTHFVSQSNPDNPALGRLHPVTLLKMTMQLAELAESDLLFGWGSLGYDCRLLYQESEAKEEAVSMAYNHIDLFWQLAVRTGFWVSLPEVAQAYGIDLDPKFSAQVPTLWNSGDITKQRQVAQHHVNATKAIMDAAKDVITRHLIRWIDKKSGKEAVAQIPLLTNRMLLLNALRLPEKALTKTVAEPISWLREVDPELQEENEIEYNLAKDK